MRRIHGNAREVLSERFTLREPRLGSLPACQVLLEVWLEVAMQDLVGQLDSPSIPAVDAVIGHPVL